MYARIDTILQIRDGINRRKKMCVAISKLTDVETDNKTNDKSIDLSEV